MDLTPEARLPAQASLAQEHHWANLELLDVRIWQDENTTAPLPGVL